MKTCALCGVTEVATRDFWMTRVESLSPSQVQRLSKHDQSRPWLVIVVCGSCLCGPDSEPSDEWLEERSRLVDEEDQ